MTHYPELLDFRGNRLLLLIKKRETLLEMITEFRHKIHHQFGQKIWGNT